MASSLILCLFILLFEHLLCEATLHSSYKHRLWNSTNWAQISVMPLPGCVTLGKLLKFTVPQCLNDEIESITAPASGYCYED